MNPRQEKNKKEVYISCLQIEDDNFDGVANKFGQKNKNANGRKYLSR